MANPKDEKQEDKVAAAYEDISKRLESIRSGKDLEESDESKEPEVEKSDGDELEEWKGPKPPIKEASVSAKATKATVDEDEHELRKVKLHNLEDKDEESEESEDEDDEKESKESEESSESKESKGEDEEKESEGQSDKDSDGGEEDIAIKQKKDWEPKENDPLDEEDPKEEAGRQSDKEAKEADLSQKGPGSLDDLTDEQAASSGTAGSDTPEDDYSIPHLKSTGQSSSNMGYNAPQRESFGESFSKSRYMDNNDPNNFFSSHAQTSQLPKRANKFHLLVLIIIGIAVIGFTVYVLKGGFGDINLGSAPSPSPSPTATPTPTPTPTPEPDRKQYKLRVLNGTGKAGLAASVSAKLKELGYQTEKTGNATNSAFTQTLIRVKPSLESFIPQIVKDLAPDFDASGNTSLKESDAVDIEVILGAK